MNGRSRRGTPVRDALLETSPLLRQVMDGLRAMRRSDRACLALEIRDAFADSLDLDAALRGPHPGENRWDYLLGHVPSRTVIGVEPHSARQDELSTVIRKKRAATEQLGAHLRRGRQVSKWLWIASGRVAFADTEKARRLLDQNGILFIGRRVLARDIE